MVAVGVGVSNDNEKFINILHLVRIYYRQAKRIMKIRSACQFDSKLLKSAKGNPLKGGAKLKNFEHAKFFVVFIYMYDMHTTVIKSKT